MFFFKTGLPNPLASFFQTVYRSGIKQEFCQMARSKLSIVREFWSFMKVRKKFWLAPLLMSMVLLGLLLVVAQGSAVAPFIYTLF